MNPVKALQQHGQAVWLDFLTRGFIGNGGLKKLIDQDGVRGVTSNPSIFEKAINGSDEYDEDIRRTLQQGDSGSSACTNCSPSRTSSTPPTCCGRYSTRPVVPTAM